MLRSLGICFLLVVITKFSTASECPGGGKPLGDEKKSRVHRKDIEPRSTESESCESHSCPSTHKCYNDKCCPPVNDFAINLEIAGKKISVKRTDCIEGQPLKDSNGKNRACGNFFTPRFQETKCPKGYDCVEHLDHSVCCPPPSNATKRWTGSCEAISEALDFGLGCMMPFAANLGLKFEKIKNDPSYHSRFDSIPDLSTAYGLSLGSGDSSGKQEFDQLVPSGAPGISKIAGSQDRRKWNGRLKEAMCGYAIEKLDDCLNDKSFLDFTGCSSLEISAQNILLQLNIKCGRYPEFDNSTYAGVECIRAILNTTAGDKCVVEHGQKGLEKEFVEGPKDGYPHLCGGLKSTFDCFEPLVKANCQQKDAQKLFNNAKDFYDSVFKFAFGTGCVLKGVGVY